MKSNSYNIIADVNMITENEWLEIRKGLGIGGSEAASCVGLNPYKSKLSLYLDKIGEGKKFEGNIHTKFGKRMEPIIRQWFKEDYETKENTKIEVSEYPFLMQSIENPFMIADIDGKMIHSSLGEGMIEIKTVSEMKRKEWQDEEIPDSYYCQIQHYLSVTNLNYCMIIGLIGKELTWKYVPRNESFINQLIEAEKQFWNEHVLVKIPPAPDGTDSSREALNYMYQAINKDTVLELHDMQEKRNRFKELNEEIKKLSLEQETIKQEFMSKMGNAEIALIGDKKITWKTQTRKSYVVPENTIRVLRMN